MGKKLTNNWGLKLIAILFALILWFAVINIDDPVVSETFKNVPVQIMNTEVEAGSEDPIQLSIELPAGTKQVINYTPRHFLALKEALKMYSNEE